MVVAVYGYFYSQLNSNFTWFTDQLGPNAAVKFESTNNEIQQKQTDLNVFVIEWRDFGLMKLIGK